MERRIDFSNVIEYKLLQSISEIAEILMDGFHITNLSKV